MPSGVVYSLLTTACHAAIVLLLALYPINVQADDLNVYFGNLHSHTSYSDGSGTPEQAYRHARDAGLDFLAVTEHNHRQADGQGELRDGLLIATDPSLYAGPQASALIPAARALTQDGQFVALYGQEFSSISKGNHVNVFEVPRVIDVPNGEFGRLLNQWICLSRCLSGESSPRHGLSLHGAA